MPLDGRIAIVTGGAQGLGRLFCLALAKEGAKVVVADTNSRGASQVAQEIVEKGGNAFAIEADVSEDDDTKKMADNCANKYGRIDILVNNAAMYYGLKHTPFEELSIEEWDRVMAVNVKGVWLCTKAVAPYMRRQKSGKIINISSAAPLKGSTGRLHYNTSKTALIGMTRSLARELGMDGINVNAVAPGFTMTETSKLMSEEARWKNIPSRRCIHRLEEPEDVVGAVIFLASNMSDFITGQTIAVDGGDMFL